MIDWIRVKLLGLPRRGYRYHPSRCPNDHFILEYDYTCDNCGEWIGLRGPY